MYHGKNENSHDGEGWVRASLDMGKLGQGIAITGMVLLLGTVITIGFNIILS